MKTRNWKVVLQLQTLSLLRSFAPFLIFSRYLIPSTRYHPKSFISPVRWLYTSSSSATKPCRTQAWCRRSRLLFILVVTCSDALPPDTPVSPKRARKRGCRGGRRVQERKQRGLALEIERLAFEKAALSVCDNQPKDSWHSLKANPNFFQ